MVHSLDSSPHHGITQSKPLSSSPPPAPPPTFPCPAPQSTPTTSQMLLLLLLVALLLLPAPSSPSPCSPPLPPSCRPFPSPPPFPFSFSPGCGHPSFLLHCSPSNHTILSLSSRPFLLLSLHLPSRSIVLLPLRPLPVPLPSPFLFPHRRNRSSRAVRILWNPSSDPFFSLCSSCRGSCGYDSSDPTKSFLCFREPGRHPRPHRIVLLAASLFALASLAALTLAIAAAVAFRRNTATRSAEDPMTGFLRRHHLQLRSPVYTFDELSNSTDGFSPCRKIGDGGFGSVYLARLGDGSVAAVKKLHRRHPAASSRSFCNEILILSAIQHPNLVRLHGYCYDPRGLLLVYDYVANGTLADHLHRGAQRKAALTWPMRVDVALQTASVMEYLHFSVKPPIVHRDITSSNIFMEADMRIKVGDFGLSRLLRLPADACGSSAVAEFVCTGPQGTPGYLDPDYHRSFRLTEKSDVYSFGVVLLELITGMKAVDVRREKREVGLADMVVSKIQVGELYEVVDPVLMQQGQAMGTVEAVAELAFRCLASDKDDRPDSRELVQELKRIWGKVQEMPSRPAAG